MDVMDVLGRSRLIPNDTLVVGHEVRALTHPPCVCSVTPLSLGRPGGPPFVPHHHLTPGGRMEGPH